MSHYEVRLDADLTQLRGLVAKQGKAVLAALDEATRAFLDADRDRAAAVMLGDHPINRRSREIDHLSHVFVARHVPSAGHLRFISSLMRMNIALERIGDYAVTISRETAQLQDTPPASMRTDIEMMSLHGCQLLEQALSAFQEDSAATARAAIALKRQRGTALHEVFKDLLAAGEVRESPIEDLFGVLVVLYRLDRVADQAKNMCEDVIFSVTGEVKQPKVYKVLFLDEKNDRLSQLAEAVARRAFPGSGVYESAGWQPDRALDPALVSFMTKHNLDLGSLRPSQLDTDYDDLAKHHVIVSLQGDARPHIPDLPFHTVLLHWEVGEPTGAVTEEALAQSQKELAHRITLLMETLRGEGAS